jgi:EAL domain-containing protein (putative c-di-GMP-specific phosphodiesterase class I)
VFEITETAAIANMHRARTFVERLTEIGCQFAIDDFGAGFGSFYYLKHLQFDYIKIDGEFVSSCVDNPTDQLVISSLVTIARGLNKKTICEFVGDARTLELLRTLGVDYAQGYYIGKPVPAETLLSGELSRVGRG